VIEMDPSNIGLRCPSVAPFLARSMCFGSVQRLLPPQLCTQQSSGHRRLSAKNICKVNNLKQCHDCMCMTTEKTKQKYAYLRQNSNDFPSISLNTWGTFCLLSLRTQIHFWQRFALNPQSLCSPCGRSLAERCLSE
jgi:hypothetical protein